MTLPHCIEASFLPAPLGLPTYSLAWLKRNSSKVLVPSSSQLHPHLRLVGDDLPLQEPDRANVGAELPEGPSIPAAQETLHWMPQTWGGV